jgi:hypothetical protein
MNINTRWQSVFCSHSCAFLVISLLSAKIFRYLHVIDWYTCAVWKQSLHSDGKKYIKYQQEEQPPITSNNRMQKRPRQLTLDITVLAIGIHKNVAGKTS